MKTLNHYTVTTGHNRVSPRSEVEPGVVESLAPMLSSGVHQMPGFRGYTVRVTVDGSTLAATVHHGSAPLATVIVCTDEPGLRAALKATGAIPAVPLAPPAALVDVHETASGDPALKWLADFERCLAWAFLESRP